MTLAHLCERSLVAGRILRIKDLIELTGLSRSAIYDRMDTNSSRCDPDFPKSIALGGTAIGWFLDDVERWLAICANRPKQKPAAKRAAGLPGAKKRRQARVSLPKPDSGTPIPTSTRGLSLAEAIFAGGQLNTKLLEYLRMEQWSATAAALLISGVTPPDVGCTEVPEGGIGLEGTPLHASNSRFHLARRLLQRWRRWDEEEGEEPKPTLVEPIRFLAWCSEEEIDTEWLRLFKDLSGMRDSGGVDLTAAQLALTASSTKLP